MLKYEKVLKANGLSFNPFEIKTHNENDKLTKKTLSSITTFMRFDRKVFSEISITNELDKFTYSLSIELHYLQKEKLNLSNLKNIDFQIIQDYLNIEKTIFNKCSFSHTLIISGLFDEVNDTIISQNYVINCFRHSSSKKYSYRIDNLIDDIDSKLKNHDVIYSKDKTDEIINLLKLIYY